MKKENFFDEKHIMLTFIKILIEVFKWLCLSVCVVFAGLTASFVLLALVKGNDVSSPAIVRLFTYITWMGDDVTLNSLHSQGLLKFVIAGTAAGATTSFTYGLYYVLLGKLRRLYDSIVDGEMFTKENVDLINESIQFALLAAFTQPVLMYATVYSTGIFDDSIINISGIVYVAVACFLKLIFEKGYATQKKVSKTEKMVADAKAVYGELKMEVLAKEVELKEKAKEIKAAKEEIKTLAKEETKVVKKAATEVKKTAEKAVKEVKKTADKTVKEVKETAKKSRKPRTKKK